MPKPEFRPLCSYRVFFLTCLFTVVLSEEFQFVNVMLGVARWQKSEGTTDKERICFMHVALVETGK